MKLPLLEAAAAGLPRLGKMVIVDPKEWKSSLRKPTDGRGKVVKHEANAIVIQFLDSKETVVAQKGEFKIDNTEEDEAHEAWREKIRDKRQGRHYHE